MTSNRKRASSTPAKTAPKRKGLKAELARQAAVDALIAAAVEVHPQGAIQAGLGVHAPVPPKSPDEVLAHAGMSDGPEPLPPLAAPGLRTLEENNGATASNRTTDTPTCAEDSVALSIPKALATGRPKTSTKKARDPRNAASPPPITSPSDEARPGAISSTGFVAEPVAPTAIAEAHDLVPEAETPPSPTLVPDAMVALTPSAPSPKVDHKPSGVEDSSALPDFDALALNMGRLIDYCGKAAAAYLKPREGKTVTADVPEDAIDTFQTMSRVAESWFTNPARMIQAQVALSSQLFGLWGDSFARLSGGTPAPQTESSRKPDKRFSAPEWQESPMFDFLHRAYLATTDWAKTMVDDAEGVDEGTREKAGFYLRQMASAMSPSNFLATNPELLKDTFRESGDNLVRGMQMLAEDIAAGNGDLKIRQSDPSKFTLGVDMASTPGKVVYRNDLMELIQYAPLTSEVVKRPLLIVPPWINKFYVLDLNKEKSLIRWAVSEGLTVFVISWVNPDERHAAKDWDAYMREGIFAALDAIEQAVGETEVSTIGYCVGGTLLAATLAYMAAKGDKRVASSTFLTTQVDFKDAGDLKVFADEAQIRVIEKEMKASGYLAGSKMANAFNMLRPDDLIWSYAVNTYLKGKAPAPFDLLAWNSDATRMTAANHAFYLRNCYLENNLTKGDMVLGGETLDLGVVTIPIYDLAAKEDHIAPARSVFNGAKFFGGPVRYVLAGSGHIAGVVNPPAKAKYQYWTGGAPEGEFEAWVASATEHKGTWWVDWIAWIKAQAPATVPARVPGEGRLKPLCDAPGDYVRVQA